MNTTVYPGKRPAAKLGLQQRVQNWVDQRLPASRRHELNRHSLYIFPSKTGFGYLCLVLMLWLVGTNYENNLVLALAFLLSALFIVCILHTFANLSGLSLEFVSAAPAFSGERAELRVRMVSGGGKARDSIILRWAGSEQVAVSLVSESQVTAKIYVPVQGRGWVNPGPLEVESLFPLGILRCWTRLNMDCRILVYPRPIPAGPLPMGQALRDDGEVSGLRGTDEFAGYRDYQAGDSLRDVAWKQYARGMGLHTKDYSSLVDRRLWLDWDYLGGMSTEARLSRLCYWVLEAQKIDAEYGLRLPGQSLPPGRSQRHCEQALRMLALFGREEVRQLS